MRTFLSKLPAKTLTCAIILACVWELGSQWSGFKDPRIPHLLHINSKSSPLIPERDQARFRKPPFEIRASFRDYAKEIEISQSRPQKLVSHSVPNYCFYPRPQRPSVRPKEPGPPKVAVKPRIPDSKILFAEISIHRSTSYPDSIALEGRLLGSVGIDSFYALSIWRSLDPSSPGKPMATPSLSLTSSKPNEKGHLTWRFEFLDRDLQSDCTYYYRTQLVPRPDQKVPLKPLSAALKAVTSPTHLFRFVGYLGNPALKDSSATKAQRDPFRCQLEVKAWAPKARVYGTEFIQVAIGERIKGRVRFTDPKSRETGIENYQTPYVLSGIKPFRVNLTPSRSRTIWTAELLNTKKNSVLIRKLGQGFFDPPTASTNTEKGKN